MVENSNIIALDIDDCILPSDVNYFGRTSDSVHIMEINIKRLVMILDKYDMKIFITSSWAHILGLENIAGRLYLTLESSRDDYITMMGFGLLKKYLQKYIVGLSEGCRETDIRNLLSNNNKVVIIDDWELQHLQDEDTTNNCLYIKTIGLIDGNVGFMLHKFMTENKKIKRGLDL